MNREDFARSSIWIAFHYTAAFLNAVALLPQAWTVLRSKTADDVKSVSLPTFGMLLYIQVTFTVFGWIKQDPAYAISVAASGLASACVIGRVLYLRFFSSK